MSVCVYIYIVSRLTRRLTPQRLLPVLFLIFSFHANLRLLSVLPYPAHRSFVHFL